MDLIQVCNRCKDETERSIDGLLEVIKEIRAENEQLKSQPQESEAVKAFLDMMEPVVEEKEQLKGLGTEMLKQIAAFRAARPKKVVNSPRIKRHKKF